MFRFENPTYLYALLIIPLVWLAGYVSYKKKKKSIKRFGNPRLVTQLMPEISRYRPLIKFGLMTFALALLIIILARPQMGTKVNEEKRNGIEIIIAVDVSNSMLAQDVKPSRLDKAKMLIENLVDNFQNDKIGLIAFAGEAFVQLPITADYVSAKMFLQNLNTNLVVTQGTNIQRAISLASKSFTRQDNVGKAIIIITDGENHEPGAVEEAEKAKNKGMQVFILGVGEGQGAPIPMPNGNYLKDRNGETVMSALNENACIEIAKAGKGTYINVKNTNDAQEKLNKELTKLQKAENNAVIYSEYGEQFQAVAIIVILVLILEIIILESRNKKIKTHNLFHRKSTMIIIGMLLTCGAYAQSDRALIRKGNKNFNKQDYVNAEVNYRKAIEQNNSNATGRYNLGCALMVQQKDSAAIIEFENAGKAEQSKMRKAMSYHNIGTILQKHQLYKDAINAYKEALRNNPTDNETRYNLALCQKLLKEQSQNKQNQQQNKQKEKEKQNQEQQKQQNEKQEQQKKEMSRNNAEQLLNAAIQEEKQTQEKINRAKQNYPKRELDKNW